MRTLLIYLCSLAATNPASAVDVHAPAEVIVETGTTGILKCSFRSNEVVSSAATVSWTFRPNGSDSVPYSIFYYGGGKGFPSEHEQFRETVQFIGDLNEKDASIQLLQVQPNNQGTYFCDVKNPPDVSGLPSRTQLTVAPEGSVQDESTHGNCSTDAQHYEHLSSGLQKVLECREDLLPQWSTEQTAKLLISMRSLTNSIQEQQRKACLKADLGDQTNKCPDPLVPENGGLACVTVNKNRYCKPLCNKGFDFRFIRRSRLYERCGADTQFSWHTQDLSRGRLADCISSSVPVSGGATAYFQQDCLTTQSSNHPIIQTFIAELRERGELGVDGATSHACLACE